MLIMPFHSDGRKVRGCSVVHLLSQEPYRDPILVLFPLRRIGRRYRHWFVSGDLLQFLFLSLTRSWYSTHAVEEGQAVNGSFSFNVTSVSVLSPLFLTRGRTELVSDNSRRNPLGTIADRLATVNWEWCSPSTPTQRRLSTNS